ncbi:MAG: hypothetical protein KF716_29995 [Anaerolineae bacterium]|nr:hypothetical protein [Anaerolineae bacterium]
MSGVYSSKGLICGTWSFATGTSTVSLAHALIIRGNFGSVVKQVLQWLENHLITGSIIQHLDQVQGAHHQEIELLLNTKIDASRYYYLITQHASRHENEPEFRGYTPVDLEQHASACLRILRAAASKPTAEFYCSLAIYITQEKYTIDKNPLETLKETAIRDLYEYLDEQLDGINAVNGLLFKYKQNVEWFQRERIQEILQNGYAKREGERALAIHLQQYIFDQGVEFTIEPSSASGEVDLLLRNPSGQFTIIDAKLIQPKASRSDIVGKVAKGFNQVSRYCNDYNQPEGFLAVFINDDLSIQLNIDQNYAFRFFKIGGRVIYYVEINIGDRKSASKSGEAKQILIEKDELFQHIESIGKTV